MRRLVLAAILAGLFALPSAAQENAQSAKQPDLSCDGKVKILPADLVGHEYRGECVDGIWIFTWPTPARARFGKARNALFIVAFNTRELVADVYLGDFAVASMDKNHPNDPKRVKIIGLIDPSVVVSSLARLFAASPTAAPPPSNSESDIYDANGNYLGSVVPSNPSPDNPTPPPYMQRPNWGPERFLWSLNAVMNRTNERRQAIAQNEAAGSPIVEQVARTAFTGGAITPNKAISGFLYFGKIKGVHPWLMYVPGASMVDTVTPEIAKKAIRIPLGDWQWRGLVPQ
jgi:hypothetical protein